MREKVKSIQGKKQKKLLIALSTFFVLSILFHILGQYNNLNLPSNEGNLFKILAAAFGFAIIFPGAIFVLGLISKYDKDIPSAW